MLAKSISSVKHQQQQLFKQARHAFSAGNNNFGKFILLFLVATPAHQRIAYAEEISKHRQKLPLYDLEPRTENSWIAPNATLSKSIIESRHD